MNSRPYKALLLLLLITALSLSACQSNAGLPVATYTQVAGVKPQTAAPVTRATATSQTLSPTNPPADPPAPTAAPTQDLRSLKGQTILFWNPWEGDLARRAEDAVNEFNRSNEWGLTVKVKAWYSAGALYDGLNAATQAAGSELPAVIAATQDQLGSWSAQGDVLVDLNAYANSPQVGFSADEAKAFNPVFWSQDQQGGRQIAIPALRTAQVLYYNQTWAKELGFSSAPKTPDQFKQQACAAAKKNNASRVLEKYGTGGWLIDSDPLTTLSWLDAFGAKPLPTADNQPYHFESPEAEKAVSFLSGLLGEGCAWLPRMADTHDYFSRREALFYTGSLADALAQSRWQAKANSKDEWTAIPFPGQDGKPVVYSSGYSYALLRSKPDTQLAAWLFIRWMEKAEIAVQLTQALPSIPVSSTVAAQLSASNANFPWTMILPLSNEVRPAPAQASWREARRLLEDASWQVYHSTPDGLAQILPQLDESLQELLKKP